MNSDWPDDLKEFEGFLTRKGLACRRRGKLPSFGDELMHCGNKDVSVRVGSERGVWFADVADAAGRPEEWYDAAIIRDLLEGSGDDVLTLSQQLRIIEENWLAILAGFAPNNREQTHGRLGDLRKERAKRRFPGLT